MAELTDAVADVAEEVGEQAFEVAAVTRALSGRDLAIGIGIGLVIGAGISFWLTRRRLEKKYIAIAEDEIDQMRDHYRQKTVARTIKPEISTLGKRVEELGYVPEEPGPGDLNTTAGIEPREDRNVFQEAEVQDHWDYEVEKKNRDPSVPYVIHHDERGETGYEDVTLTFYTGDDIICDNNDKIVDDKDRVVGNHNLNKFGHGSGDAVIVYIRNEYLNLDIELIRSEQSYAEEVHGITHADQPRRRQRPEWQ